MSDYFKEIIDIAKDPRILEPLAKKMREIIYNRVKSGKGVSSDSVPSPSLRALTPLSKSYIEMRKGNAQFFKKNLKNGGTKTIGLNKEQWPKISAPVLGEFGSPSRSNLTLSGQMLDSMQGRVGRDGSIEVLIPNTTRQPIKRVAGPPIPSNGLTNAQVAQKVSGERPFMALSDGEIRILTKQYEDALRSELKKIFN